MIVWCNGSARRMRELTEGSAAMEIVRNVPPPKGITRSLFRLPLPLYRLGLGGLFGRRLVVVQYIGHISGRPREVVLESVAQGPDDGSYLVASGWGPTAAWYRSLLRTPDVTIRVGARTLPVRAVPLSADEGAEIFARYAARRRRVAKFMLRRVMGYAVDGSDEDFLAVGRRMPFVRLVPRV
jgi:deazaflavin-dependent oxidoreductase (nitroreductase family)